MIFYLIEIELNGLLAAVVLDTETKRKGVGVLWIKQMKKN
ncbi:hypothetical protein CHCC20375_0327 [Bacillus licheniformis]|nr:hypothetical protein CHCC20375_0327 [Bacillus licheniformis]